METTTSRRERADVETLVEAVLRGERTVWPESAQDPEARRLLAQASESGVVGLLARRLATDGALATWPDRIQGELRAAARGQLARECFRQMEIDRVLSALGEAGIASVVMKGTAMAYTLYPQPYLRPRCDTDVMIRHANLAALEDVMGSLEYRRPNVLTGEFVTNQLPFVRHDSRGIQHVFDVHWKVSNRPLLADLLTFDEVRDASVPVPALGPFARALGPVHALLIACVHPVAHHNGADFLIWLCDVDLLVRGMSEGDVEQFLALVRDRLVQRISARTLSLARTRLATPVRDDIIDQLSRAVDEPSAVFLDARPWRGDIRLSDLQSVPGLRAKGRLVRDVVFPTTEFMLREYRQSSRALLPFLYAHRAVRGSWRLLWRLRGARAGLKPCTTHVQKP